MKSVNFIKGYGKVNPIEDLSNPPPNHHRRRRRITIVLSLAVILTLAIASLVAVLTHRSEQSGSPPLASDPAGPLRTVCAVTRYPDSCFSSISSLDSPPLSADNNNPLRFFNLSLHASLLEVSSLRSRLAEPTVDPAAKDCADLFDDAAAQLRRSTESIGEKAVLKEMKVSDLQTWISAAMTDEETCVDGMEEMGSTAVSELRARVQRSQEYMSNTLAILNNIQSLYKKFGLSP